MLRTTTHPVAHTHRGKSTITGLGWRAQDASPPTVPPPNTLSGENQAAKTSLSKPMGGRFEKSRLDRSTNRAPISGRTIVPLTEQLVRTQGLPAAKTTRIEDETPTKRVLVEAHTSRRTVQIKCCGQWISCDQFTTLCDNCGAGYDHAGQRLKPRYQWSDAR